MNALNVMKIRKCLSLFSMSAQPCLVGLAAEINKTVKLSKLGLLRDQKEAANYHCHRWNVGTGHGLREFRPVQVTAGQTSSRKIPAVTTSAVATASI